MNAASHDEAQAVYDDMLAQMEDAGLAECEEYINEQYQARQALWYGE